MDHCNNKGVRLEASTSATTGSPEVQCDTLRTPMCDARPRTWHQQVGEVALPAALAHVGLQARVADGGRREADAAHVRRRAWRQLPQQAQRCQRRHRAAQRMPCAQIGLLTLYASPLVLKLNP